MNFDFVLTRIEWGDNGQYPRAHVSVTVPLEHVASHLAAPAVELTLPLGGSMSEPLQQLRTRVLAEARQMVDTEQLARWVQSQ